MKKNISIIESRRQKAHDRFASFIERADEDFQLIINAHLICEAEMNDFLTSRFRNVAAFQKANLRFNQKLNLVTAFLGEFGKNNVCRTALEKLGNIRNRYAHNLELAGIEPAKKDFLRFLRKEFDLNGELEEAVHHLCGYVSACLHFSDLEFRHPRKLAREIAAQADKNK